MANLYKKTRTVTDPKTGRKARRKSKKWWGKYRDSSGKICRVPLVTDKSAAQAMLNELVRKADREKAGLVDPTEEQRKRRIGEHLADFSKYLDNKGSSAKQVQEVITWVRKMIVDRRWKLIGDISASGALEFWANFVRRA